MATRALSPIPRRAPRANPAETLALATIGAKAMAEHVRPRERLAFAREMTRRAIEYYWRLARPARHSLPALGGAHDGAKLPGGALTLAAEIGAAATLLDPIEAGYAIGRTYAAVLPEAMRTSLGVYYTPPAVVERLLDQATEAGVDWRTCRVLDPACGGGAFLAPVARRMCDAMNDCEPAVLLRNIGERLAGFEVDPFAAWMSQVFLEAMLAERCSSTRTRLPKVITVCDSLSSRESGRGFDLVVGNPPYGRITLEAEQRATYARSLYGHANLYGLFTDLALRHASPDGIIAYVTPTSFLGGQYFRRLRELLLKEARPVAIDFIRARRGVFDDVLQETLLATYARGRRGNSVRVCVVEPSASSAEVTALGDYELPAAGGPWILPRSIGERTLAAAASRMPHRLRDWGYSVSTGPLVWNRHKPQLRRRPVGSVPLIWAEAVRADGVFSFRAEKKNHAPYFRPKRGDDWLLVREPCVLVQRTTAKEQQRRINAAELPAAFLREHEAVAVENHLNMVRCAGVPYRAQPIAPALLVAFLNTQVVDRVFRCISGSVAVSAFELEALPVPPPDTVIALQDLIDDREALESACRGLYGVD